MKNIALILASGTGSRFSSEIPKQFYIINGKTVIEYTVSRFQNSDLIDEIYLVTNSEYIPKVSELINKYSKIKKIVPGGETRKDSSYNGVNSIDENECNLLIHDGARPFITDEIIKSCISAMDKYSAVCTTIDSTDTIFETNEAGIITNIPQRKKLKRAQTPQCFKLSIIKKAHELAKSDETCSVTDDCGLVFRYDLCEIKTIEGSLNNIKITYPEDIDFAEKYLN